MRFASRSGASPQHEAGCFSLGYFEPSVRFFHPSILARASRTVGASQVPGWGWGLRAAGVKPRACPTAPHKPVRGEILPPVSASPLPSTWKESPLLHLASSPSPLKAQIYGSNLGPRRPAGERVA